MILNINYNNTFDKSRFKFKEFNDIILFILILNKGFMYFVNSVTCKRKIYL